MTCLRLMKGVGCWFTSVFSRKRVKVAGECTHKQEIQYQKLFSNVTFVRDNDRKSLLHNTRFVWDNNRNSLVYFARFIHFTDKKSSISNGASEQGQTDIEGDNSSRGEDQYNKGIGSGDYLRIVADANFIDKSKLLEIVWQSSAFVMIAGPSRFGKSVNLSMMQYFFEVNVDKEFKPISNLVDVNKNDVTNFENLNVTEIDEKDEEKLSPNFAHFKTREIYRKNKKFVYENCGVYPTIELNFQSVMSRNYEGLVSSLKKIIGYAYQKYEQLYLHCKLKPESSNVLLSDLQKFQRWLYVKNHINLTDDDIATALSELADFLKKHFNRSCVILIDEYDSVIDQMIFYGIRDETETNLMLDLLGRMLGTAFKSKSTQFGVMMVRTITRGTLSAYCSNLNYHFFLRSKSTFPYLGITSLELDALLKKFGANDKNEIKEKIKLWYDGYSFAEDDERLGNMEIYNFKSIIDYFTTNKLYGHWTSSVGIRTLENFFRNEHVEKILFDLLTKDKKIIIPGNYEIDLKQMELLRRMTKMKKKEKLNLTPLFYYMYSCGYFTAKMKGDNYVLGIPNEEIKGFLSQKLLQSKLIEENVISDVVDVLEDLTEDSGKEEFQKISEKLLILFEHIFSQSLNVEASFQAVLLCCFYSHHLDCETGKHVNLWNIKKFDIILTLSNDFLIIFELKHNHNREKDEEALNQIFNRLYFDYNEKKQKKNILLVGLNFSAPTQDIVEVFSEYLLINETERINIFNDNDNFQKLRHEMEKLKGDREILEKTKTLRGKKAKDYDNQIKSLCQELTSAKIEHYIRKKYKNRIIKLKTTYKGYELESEILENNTSVQRLANESCPEYKQ